MGKIKGWKKKNYHTWTRNNDTLEIIRIYNKRNDIVGYNIEIFLFETRISNARNITRNFKTKKQALAYAMKYMRSHPNG